MIGVDERRRRVRVLLRQQRLGGALGEQQIAGQIDVRAAGAAVRGEPDGLLDVQRNEGGAGRTGGVLAVRTGGLDLRVFLVVGEEVEGGVLIGG